MSGKKNIGCGEEPLKASTILTGAFYVLLTTLGFAVLGGGSAGAFVFWRHALEQDNIGARLCLFAAAFICLGVGALGVLFWLPLGRSQVTGERPLAPGEEEELTRLIEHVANAVGARLPARIYVTTEVNAYASFHRGLPGVIANDTKLTVGLPLLLGLEKEELTAILAHELAHLRDAGAMRVCALAFEIEGGLARMTGYSSRWWRARFREQQKMTAWGAAGLVFSTLCEGIVKAILSRWVNVGRRLREQLLATMEFRADASAARVVGAGVVIQALESVGQLGTVIEREVGGKSAGNRDCVQNTEAVLNAARRYRTRKAREKYFGRGQYSVGGLGLERITRLRRLTGC